jgi:hypothetical protein
MCNIPIKVPNNFLEEKKTLFSNYLKMQFYIF